ncbi:hypothetical protein WJ0W_002871 [Paenibacillus melissococcoides]|uniref:Uncharacterized protein n=1 Tax=Paenibacillus melissococcoides TaxID=2912268 RepID=A0ABM9G1Z9_9BACL|nr:hypothetical protein WJ0W_002871 [Paenibacillus melissococcoides]
MAQHSHKMNDSIPGNNRFNSDSFFAYYLKESAKINGGLLGNPPKDVDSIIF